MIARTLDAGVPARLGDRATRSTAPTPDCAPSCERRGVGYVLAVARDHQVPTAAGPIRADMLTLQLPAPGLAAALGRRRRQRPPLLRLGLDRHCPAPGRLGSGGCWSAAPPHRQTRLLPLLLTGPVPLTTLVRVAGIRWTIEEDFQTGKELTGLDQHQVRRWTSWHRWATLAMLAHAFLTVTAAVEHARAPAPAGQIPLTRNEISHLFAALLLRPLRTLDQRLHWSTWRRRQASWHVGRVSWLARSWLDPRSNVLARPASMASICASVNRSSGPRARSVNGDSYRSAGPRPITFFASTSMSSSR